MATVFTLILIGVLAVLIPSVIFIGVSLYFLSQIKKLGEEVERLENAIDL
jgi:hypothetical protein